MNKLNHQPRMRDGKFACIDLPKICRISEFPELCERLQLFTRKPDTKTVYRWIERGALPTVDIAGQTCIAVHKYLHSLDLIY